MIPSNTNPPMSHNDIRKFYTGMDRRMRGELTARERELYASAKKTYETVIKNNGGKNPII